ncbi:preprotein translocase subunit Sec63 [Leptolyngbyaceae cyanobacterium JSC-12]|nr:preprotein translocase subunit Sec63 [Leptolyngbyaceae cyanobacterium JSC-12]
MSQSSLVSDWVNKFTDPFAVLGVSVTADDRRVQKRYRSVAMRLHPDRFVDADEVTKDITGKLLARLVNPAYEKIQQEKGRKEHLALLRLKVRRLTREGPLSPKSQIARELMQCPVSDVDVFYEQAIAKLADSQFEPYDQFNDTTEQLLELNLVYLQLKMGDLGVQEKRTGLVAGSEAKPIQFAPAPANPEVMTESYDQRHYRRAQEYAKKRAWSQVVQELRDAIKIKADKSEYHSLLGIAYLNLEKPLPGMAKVHLKRALELNPSDAYAQKIGPKLGLVVPASTHQNNGKQPSHGTKATSQSIKRGGLFGLFGKK